eukprot:TRINITY_DN2346_c0_g1_i1.p1 TRINITY_DN2346_c0_g1~~TRINITY_DN2346_c0_g1_i1.p1  ORF type:complete len:410 (+),score=82.83 TRINITY_DN2346_c0_g1_i1:147-1376(+)
MKGEEESKEFEREERRDYKEIEEREGQIVQARKCNKFLFFIDLRIDENRKEQILFRTDDQSMNQIEWEDLWKKVKRGNKIRLSISLPTLPREQINKSFPIFQSTNFQIIQIFPNNQIFVSEPPLGSINNPNQSLSIDSKSNQNNVCLQKQSVCKYWISQGKCPQEEGKCLFQHPALQSQQLHQIERREMKRKRKMEKRESEEEGNHHNEAPSSHRSRIFARWLVNVFGKDALRRGTGVMDIAAGKGDVSSFLSGVYGIPCTMVEPNERKISKSYQRKIQKLIDNEIAEMNLHNCRNGIEAEVKLICSLLDENFTRDHQSTLSKSSILIGMHSDQATEKIVDTSISLGVPFAVVPCCVFSREGENKNRTTRDGGRVVTTEQFIQFLMEKLEPGQIQQQKLSFTGKNVVLY